MVVKTEDEQEQVAEEVTVVEKKPRISVMDSLLYDDDDNFQIATRTTA